MASFSTRSDPEIPEHDKVRWRTGRKYLVLLAIPLLFWEAYALSPDLRSAVVRIMSGAGRSGLPWLVDGLHDADPQVAATSQIVLLDLGRGAILPLRDRLKADEFTDRARSAYALGLLGSRARDAVPDLILAAHDPSLEVRCEAVTALAWIDGRNPQVVTELLNAIRQRDPEIRVAAAGSLAKLLPDVRPVVPALTLALADEDSRVRMVAADALGLATTDLDVVVPQLRKALHDPDLDVREEAAESLTDLGQMVDADFLSK